MALYRKREFIEVIKKAVPELKGLCEIYCNEYRKGPYSEWLEIEYGNYVYLFYHTAICGQDILRYRKRRFVAEPNDFKIYNVTL